VPPISIEAGFADRRICPLDAANWLKTLLQTKRQEKPALRFSWPTTCPPAHLPLQPHRFPLTPLMLRDASSTFSQLPDARCHSTEDVIIETVVLNLIGSPVSPNWTVTAVHTNSSGVLSVQEKEEKNRSSNTNYCGVAVFFEQSAMWPKPAFDTACPAAARPIVVVAKTAPPTVSKTVPNGILADSDGASTITLE